MKHSGCQHNNSSGYHSAHVRVEEAALRTRVTGVKRKAKITIQRASSGSKIPEPAPTWPTTNTITVAMHNHQTNNGRLLSSKASTQDSAVININILVTILKNIKEDTAPVNRG